MSEILERKNIILNSDLKTKKDVIKAMGKMLTDSGYTTEKYIQAMLDKEKVFNTAIGNFVAIPHGIESGKVEVLKTGLAVMTFPDGIDWDDGNTVKLIVAIAADGDEHIDILSKIALACYDEAAVEKIIQKGEDEILAMFTE